MRIKSIRLSNNYKRFHDLTIDLGEAPKKIIALVGPNGSGKSSVFDGMLFLNNAYEQIGDTGGKDYKFHSMTGNKIPHTAIQITFSDGRSYDAVRASRTENNKQNTIFSFRNSYRYSSILNVTTLSTIPDIKLNNIGASSSIDIDNKINNNYQRLYSYINECVKSSELNYKQVKEKVLGDLNKILSACLGLEIFDHGDIINGKGTMFFRKQDQAESFDFNVLSSGEKEVVDILLDIYLKKETYTETVFLIDEPELHLNTKIQRNLLIELEKLIPENCQLWIATHSIGFLNALQNELNAKSDVIFFTGDYATKATTITPIKKTRRKWQEIFNTALEDLTGLVSPKTIIYCEGKVTPTADGKEAGFDAEVYNKIFEVEKPEALFISSGGNTEPDKYASIALKVLGKAFSGVQLLLLKDKDIHSDGSETTEQDRIDFIKKSPATNRMLKKREIEDYIFDYEIIEKAYNKVAKADYDEWLADAKAPKDKVGGLMSICGIKTGMNKEAFKKHLAEYISPDTNVYKELEEAIFC